MVITGSLHMEIRAVKNNQNGNKLCRSSHTRR